jgi:hypothetical protein
MHGHAHKMGLEGRHKRGGRHGHIGHGIMHHPMSHIRPPMRPMRTANHRDFEKEYTNVEQTYSNHLNIRH